MKLKSEHSCLTLSYLKNIRSVKLLIFDWLRKNLNLPVKSICAEDGRLKTLRGKIENQLINLLENVRKFQLRTSFEGGKLLTIFGRLSFYHKAI
jgi:hypothetical protein